MGQEARAHRQRARPDPRGDRAEIPRESLTSQDSEAAATESVGALASHPFCHTLVANWAVCDRRAIRKKGWSSSSTRTCARFAQRRDDPGGDLFHLPDGEAEALRQFTREHPTVPFLAAPPRDRVGLPVHVYPGADASSVNRAATYSARLQRTGCCATLKITTGAASRCR